MYEQTSYRYPFGPSPTPKGLGQTAMCPSLEQMMGIVDCSDPCQVNTVTCAGANATVLPDVQACYNMTTGAQISCPVAGSTQSSTPANIAPGVPLSATNLNWGVLAAVLGGLVLLAAMSGK